MKVFICNVTSSVSKSFVKSELERLGIDYTSIEGGIIELPDHIENDKLEIVKVAMHPYGFELFDTRPVEIVPCGFRGGPIFSMEALPW